MTLEIKNLSVSIENKTILEDLHLTLEKGKIYCLMGPNGSGKSTLANVLMGNSKYEITQGKIIFEGADITNLPTHKRAQKGLFMSFQYPQEIDGVSVINVLRQARNAIQDKKISAIQLRKLIEEKAKEINLDKQFLDRYLKGFSGGEKKKSEILQLLVLDPKLAILDETDSGLDIDSLREIANSVKKFMTPQKICLVITHYKRVLEYLHPDHVFILKKGKLVAQGGHDLVETIEKQGYAKL